MAGWRPLHRRPGLRMAVWSQFKVGGADLAYGRSVCDTKALLHLRLRLAALYKCYYRPLHAFVFAAVQTRVKLHLRDGRTDGRTKRCDVSVRPSVRLCLRWSVTHSLHKTITDRVRLTRVVHYV